MSVDRRSATVGDAVVNTARQERILKDAEAEQHGHNCGGQGESRLRTAGVPFGKGTDQAQMATNCSVTVQRLMPGMTYGQSRGNHQQQSHKTG